MQPQRLSLPEEQGRRVLCKVNIERSGWPAWGNRYGLAVVRGVRGVVALGCATLGCGMCGRNCLIYRIAAVV